MFVRIVAEKHNVLFECTRVVERENGMTFLTGVQGDIVHTELLYNDEEQLFIYAMNNEGKTIERWNISPEGKQKQ